MVVQVGSDDFHGFLYPGGAFALESALVGIAAMLSMERGFARFGLAIVHPLRHIRRVERTLPLIDGYPAAFGRRVDFIEQWLAHPEPGDPYWITRRAVADPDRVPPASLLTGWTDVCLDPTLALYRRLRDAGRDVRLVVGPWNHTSGFSDDMPAVFDEALRWLRAYTGGEGGEADSGSGLTGQPVRVHVGEIGARGEWRDLPDWPPPGTRDQTWHLHGDGTLATEPPATAEMSSLRYDPAAPTPSVGGPSMDARHTGPQRNNKLEARADVLVFTSSPLAEPTEVIGPVSIKLRVRGSSAHFDVFARLCDVDARGRSWNICDGLLRLGGAGTADDPAPGDGGRPWSDLTVPMSAIAHRFGGGHRLRVQISGGAHPRFARNTGTGDPIATATRLVPVDIEISHGPAWPCLLSLPMTADMPEPAKAR
jgi:putative CocE/NonD family hydrolase